MRIASIDIGTNTILLLIAEIDLKKGTFVTIHEEIRMPRIGNEIHSTGNISEDKIDLLEEILIDYKRICEVYCCTMCFAIGTHAMRNASNNTKIINRIRKNVGITIEIISPTEEAEFAFYGVQAFANTTETFAIVDIGGGSTEIIIGKGNNLLEKISVPIGVVTLKDKYISAFPIPSTERVKLKEAISNSFSQLNLEYLAPKVIIGISGTPTTLSAITQKLKLFDVNSIDKSILTKEDIQTELVIMGDSTLKEIRTIYGEIINKRDDILYIGGVILLHIMNYFNLPKLIVSAKGIRHGVIYKKLIIDK